MSCTNLAVWWHSLIELTKMDFKYWKRLIIQAGASTRTIDPSWLHGQYTSNISPVDAAKMILSGQAPRKSYKVPNPRYWIKVISPFALIAVLCASIWFWLDAKRLNEETRLTAEDRKDLAAAHALRQSMEQEQADEKLRFEMRNHGSLRNLQLKGFMRDTETPGGR